MNLLLLLAGVRVWTGTPVEGVTRVLLAVSLLSLEMQLASWTGVATLSTLVPVNAILAVGLFVWYRRQPHSPSHPYDTLIPGWQPVAALMLAVVTFNLGLPLGTADP